MEKIIDHRTHTLCHCRNCGKEKWKRNSHLKTSPTTFCDRKCQAEWTQRGNITRCANPDCKQEIYRSLSQQKRSQSGDFFCSRSCATIVNNTRHKSGEDHPNWVDGLSGYRDKALSCYGEKCQNPECTEDAIRKMLDVHHIDGNRSNNHMNNLVILCVWCHALVTRGLDTVENMISRGVAQSGQRRAFGAPRSQVQILPSRPNPSGLEPGERVRLKKGF